MFFINGHSLGLSNSGKANSTSSDRFKYSDSDIMFDTGTVKRAFDGSKLDADWDVNKSTGTDSSPSTCKDDGCIAGREAVKDVGKGVVKGSISSDKDNGGGAVEDDGDKSVIRGVNGAAEWTVEGAVASADKCDIIEAGKAAVNGAASVSVTGSGRDAVKRVVNGAAEWTVDNVGEME